MAEFDLVIRGGDVATASDLFQADIGVRDGVITALGQKLGAGEEEIDARGKLVLPGGVDSHVHADQRSSNGQYTADDWFTATRSAACGGTTFILPFAAQHKGMSLRQVVKDYHDLATPKACIDYGFHLIISDPTPHVVGQELPALVREGYSSFKFYMTYDLLKLNDGEILDVLSVARNEGAFVMVHAENHDAIAYLSQRLLAHGHVKPKFHAESRPMPVEREATHRVIALSELVDVPILIVHVSGREAIDQIRWAQGRGLKIFAETCPQYLFLCAEDLDQPDWDGAKCMCSPPPREKANQPYVWQALQTGVFQTLSSDHAPYRFNDPEGKGAGIAAGSFKKISNGIPGLEVRMPLMFSEGVGKGRLDIHQFVALTCTNPAKLYGVHPKKGTIAVGSDADVAIWDTEKEVTITQSILHDAMDYTPYEGMKVKGWPVMTFSRGKLVCKDMEFLGQAGAGRFHARHLSAQLKPTGRFAGKFDPHTGVYNG
jgi:dihydropyrimidinase